jgi:TfoX/Sxy family transcriptional regulator of competence genes
MATEKSTVEFIVDQLESLDVRTRAMFGEYGLYCDEKVVAFICDDTLFLKQTEAGTERAPDAKLGPAYPGSKDYMIIDGDRIESRESFQELIQATANELPPPKPKKPKKAKK